MKKSLHMILELWIKGVSLIGKSEKGSTQKDVGFFQTQKTPHLIDFKHIT